MKKIKSGVLVITASFSIIASGQFQSNAEIATATNTVANTTSSYDARVLSLLREEEIKYVINDDWDFVITYGTSNPNWDVQVHVNSNTSRFGSLEIREIWAIAYISKTALSAEATSNMLKRNSVIKTGSWSIRDLDNGICAVIFTVTTDARNLKAAELHDIIRFVAVTASGTNEEMTKSGKPTWPVE